jgi:predicted membrane-bound mannosyltransferase
MIPRRSAARGPRYDAALTHAPVLHDVVAARGWRHRRGVALVLGVAVAAGVLVRAWNLTGQVLADDELHLVNAVTRGGIREALTTYRPADTSLPLTGLFRALYVAEVPLTELTFRLPALLAGLALLLLPLAFARRLSPATVAGFAVLVAIWPSLVLYSRIARSYAPMALCCCVAVVAFDGWWQNRRWWLAALYAGAAPLAAWLHPMAAPAALAPLAYGALVLAARRAAGWSRWRELLALALATGIAFAAFLVPAWPSLRALLAAKRVGSHAAGPGCRRLVSRPLCWSWPWYPPVRSPTPAGGAAPSRTTRTMSATPAGP